MGYSGVKFPSLHMSAVPTYLFPTHYLHMCLCFSCACLATHELEPIRLGALEMGSVRWKTSTYYGKDAADLNGRL